MPKIKLIRDQEQEDAEALKERLRIEGTSDKNENFLELSANEFAQPNR